MFAIGDGIGGSEFRIGKTNSKEECANKCYLKSFTDRSINGATYGSGGRARECYCERRMRSRNSNKIWKSCIIKPNTPTPTINPSKLSFC